MITSCHFLSFASIHAANASKSSLWLPGFHVHPCSTSPTVHLPIFHGWSVFSLVLVQMNLSWSYLDPTHYLSRVHCLWRVTLTLGLLATLCPSTASPPWARFQYYSLNIDLYQYRFDKNTAWFHHNISHQSFGMRHHQQMGRNGDPGGNEDLEQSYRATIMWELITTKNIFINIPNLLINQVVVFPQTKQCFKSSHQLSPINGLISRLPPGATIRKTAQVRASVGQAQLKRGQIRMVTEWNFIKPYYRNFLPGNKYFLKLGNGQIRRATGWTKREGSSRCCLQNVWHYMVCIYMRRTELLGANYIICWEKNSDSLMPNSTTPEYNGMGLWEQYEVQVGE